MGSASAYAGKVSGAHVPTSAQCQRAELERSTCCHKKASCGACSYIQSRNVGLSHIDDWNTSAQMYW